MNRLFRFLLPVALVTAMPAFAQSAPVDGTYVLDGGSYSIKVRQVGDDLEVVEPNRTSLYKRQPDGSYQTYSEVMQRTYGLRIVDDRTVEAFKPGVAGATRLVRLGPVPAVRKVDIAPSDVGTDPAVTPADAVPGATGGNAAGAIADKYLALAKSDPKNAQAYAFCSAAALKRSLATATEADAYARDAAAALRQIIADPAAPSPCPDAIPTSAWDAVGGEAPDRATTALATQTGALSSKEEDRLRRLNEAADARDRALAERRQADLERQAAAQSAYREGQAQYERDRAAYEASVARSRAEQAEYQRQLQAHQELLRSGKYKNPQ